MGIELSVHRSSSPSRRKRKVYERMKTLPTFSDNAEAVYKAFDCDFTPEQLFPDRMNPGDDERCVMSTRVVNFLKKKELCNTDDVWKKRAKSMFDELERTTLDISNAETYAFSMYKRGFPLDISKQYTSLMLSPEDREQISSVL